MGTSILKIVTAGLVMALLVLVAGMIYLLGKNQPIPGTMETLSGMIVTGLLGLLAPSREAAAGG
jgi:hypothetical protein